MITASNIWYTGWYRSQRTWYRDSPHTWPIQVLWDCDSVWRWSIIWGRSHNGCCFLAIILKYPASLHIMEWSTRKLDFMLIIKTSSCRLVKVPLRRLTGLEHVFSLHTNWNYRFQRKFQAVHRHAGPILVLISASYLWFPGVVFSKCFMLENWSCFLAMNGQYY